MYVFNSDNEYNVEIAREIILDGEQNGTDYGSMQQACENIFGPGYLSRTVGEGYNANVREAGGRKGTHRNAVVGETGEGRNSESVDNTGRTLSLGQESFFAKSKVRDKQGRLKTMYHGTGRADRVGMIFRPDRATSGPMAFFTDSKDIADNYASQKSDTSLEYDERYQDYYSQFRVNRNGRDMSIPERWDSLSDAEKGQIRQAAGHITIDEDSENIIYNLYEDKGLGNWDRYLLKAHKGNALEALIDSWLEGGNLYGNDIEFLKVLSLIGIDDAQYYDPNFRSEFTYEVYLNITNPFDATDDVTEEFVDNFLDWYDRQDKTKYNKELKIMLVRIYLRKE